MKNFLLFLLLSIFFIPSKAQNFSRTYSSNAYLAQWVSPADSGNFYVAAYDDHADILVSKMDANGTPIWSKQLGEPWLKELVFDVITDDSSRLVIAASQEDGSGSYRQGWLICFQPDGQIAYSKLIGTTGEFHSPNCILKEPNNGVTIAYNFDDGASIYATKLVSFSWKGTILREKAVNNGGTLRCTRRNDGGYILYEMFGCTIIPLNATWTNSTGILHDFFSYLDFQPAKMLQVSDSDYYVVGMVDYMGWIGHLHVYYGQYFQINWVSAMNYPRDLNFRDIHRLTDGSFLIVGTSPATTITDSSQIIVVHADSVMHPLHSVVFSDNYTVESFEQMKTMVVNDSGLIFAGAFYNWSTGLAEGLRLTRTDLTSLNTCAWKDTSLTFVRDSSHQTQGFTPALISTTTQTFGYIPTITPVTMTSLECYQHVGLEEEEPRAVSLFPNPCSTTLNVEFGDQFAGSFAISIVDMSGRILLQKNRSGREKEVLDVRSLAPGMYILNCEGLEPMTFLKTDE